MLYECTGKGGGASAGERTPGRRSCAGKSHAQLPPCACVNIAACAHITQIYIPTHTHKQYGREVAASAVAFRSVNENSSGSLPLSPSIMYPSHFHEVSNASVPPLRLRESMCDDDHLLSDGPSARLALEYAMKKH
ncbi:hypothetical protein EVAR_23634_1 [Eumeta japonica]|uniref:Uncharacterized protein n=1 Tax=Eumeta variegata TaxID=151549 RepID=A0A4C1VIM3_EUMVA|nr:hypothetical protein EVAR_23634_1 [Eumeta japonica]